MLGETEIKEIKALIEKKEEGGFIGRYKIRHKKKELRDFLSELDIKEIELYEAKIREDIKSYSRQIQQINIGIINHTKKDETITDEEEEQGYNYHKS